MLIRCIVSLLVAFASLVNAEPLSIAAKEIALAPALDYVEDPSQAWNLDHVRAADFPWQANGSKPFNKGFNHSAWWLRLRLQNAEQIPLQRLLEVGYPVLDHVDVYLVDETGTVQLYNLGDKVPYEQRLYDHQSFLIPINWQPQQTLEIYLRIYTLGSTVVPLTLWDYEQFQAKDFVRGILNGTYYGGILTFAIYNLLIFFVLRDLNYLFYVGFMLSTMFTFAAQYGLTFRFLWPNATQWNDLAIIFFIACTAGFASLFTRRFLRIPTLSPLLSGTLASMALGSLLLMVSCFLFGYQRMTFLVVGHVMVTIVLCIVCGVYALVRRVPSARFYMLAWSVLLVGASAVLTSRIGLLPVNIFTEYATQSGSLLEAVLLSLALADRINMERRLRYQAQSEALMASQRANVELEQRVRERTLELEKLNVQLQQLSDTDQLTGLHNRRYLEARLQHDWAGCLRRKCSLAVLLIDIDHFKTINDRYGHPVGDSCLQQVASLVGTGLRQALDIAARYGGEEFCLALPDTDEKGALLVAERVRKRVEKAVCQAEGLQLSVTVSIGVFAAVPDQSTTLETFIKQADIALYESKQSGRNRVTVAHCDLS